MPPSSRFCRGGSHIVSRSVSYDHQVVVCTL